LAVRSFVCVALGAAILAACGCSVHSAGEPSATTGSSAGVSSGSMASGSGTGSISGSPASAGIMGEAGTGAMTEASVAEGGPTEPPSCAPGGPGLSDCGPDKESCCTSLPVPGGTSYAFCIWDGGFIPTAAELEYAQAGGAKQRMYPWGASAPGSTPSNAIWGCNCPGDGGCGIAPVATAWAGAGLWARSISRATSSRSCSTTAYSPGGRISIHASTVYCSTARYLPGSRT
jgi:hypothetical protein